MLSRNSSHPLCTAPVFAYARRGLCSNWRTGGPRELLGRLRLERLWLQLLLLLLHLRDLPLPQLDVRSKLGLDVGRELVGLRRILTQPEDQRV